MGKQVKLVSHDHLPAWSHDNEFIVNGYRTPGGFNDEIRARQSSSNGTNGTSKPVTTRRKSAAAKATKTTDQPDYFEHNSWHKCWMSIWLYLHNETVNIHTHFWGALIALLAMGLHILSVFGIDFQSLRPITHHSIFYSDALTPLPKLPNSTSWYSFLVSKPPPVTLPMRIGSFVSTPVMHIAPWLIAHQRPNDWKDIFGFATFLCGAVTVLTFSATFHTAVCHSKEIHSICNKLDYIGIVAMIVGSFLPMLHYGFYCHPHLQLFYSALILSLGSMAIYTVLARKFATPAYRSIRATVFLALGLSAIFPVAHILAMYGYEAVALTMGIQYLVAGGALYVVGACLYMARIPERFSPGTFDYFGASHQIFHVLILFAAASHYICIRRSYTFWHTAESLDGSAVCYAFESLRRSV